MKDLLKKIPVSAVLEVSEGIGIALLCAVFKHAATPPGPWWMPFASVGGTFLAGGPIIMTLIALVEGHGLSWMKGSYYEEIWGSDK